MIEKIIRRRMSRILTGEKGLILRNRIPDKAELQQKFCEIHELGLYLHIPFCDQICPYCPYNKELYNIELAKTYTKAVKKEIDFYKDIVAEKPVTSFYIGGGTPTTMLQSGIGEIIEHLYSNLNMQCQIHMESHPNHLSKENLDTLQSIGVKYLSIGVESLQDRHLHTLKRPYNRRQIIDTVKGAVNQNFNCVNIDIIFALPGQTYGEIEQDAKSIIKLGIDQVAAYPLFRFPYTKMGSSGSENIFNIFTVLKRRKMLRILEKIFYDADFRRTSVWAFTRTGIPKYCSVTVPLYIGLGASGGSYLKDIFYLNTFSVSEYIKAIHSKNTAIALSVDLSLKMQMAGWLYWRIYETRFKKSDFMKRFGSEFDSIYGKYMKPLAKLGFLTQNGDQVHLHDKGTYWLHAFEDLFSIDYISSLWGTSKLDPWPQEVKL